MKVNLIVLTPGKMQGQAIAIKLSQFLIGRDPHCQLRPANPVISNRHCAILIREDQVSVRDFGSRNGTFVNEERVTGEAPLQHNDQLRIGPLLFRVEIEASVPTKSAPASPASSAAPAVDDEAAAALLMSLQEEGSVEPGTGKVDEQGIPTGTTVMEALPPSTTPEVADPQSGKPDEKAPEPKKEAPKTGDTATAANAILQKYLRRPRK